MLLDTTQSDAPLSFFHFTSMHLSVQTTNPSPFPVSSRVIPSPSINPCIHPTQPTLFRPIYLFICPPFLFWSLLTRPSTPSPLLVFPSPSFPSPPHRELAGWSWRRRWRRGQVVTTMTSGGAGAVPAVAARRRWAIWDSAPSMAVSLWSWVCECVCHFLVSFCRFITLQFENQLANTSM